MKLVRGPVAFVLRRCPVLVLFLGSPLGGLLAAQTSPVRPEIGVGLTLPDPYLHFLPRLSLPHPMTRIAFLTPSVDFTRKRIQGCDLADVRCLSLPETRSSVGLELPFPFSQPARPGFVSKQEACWCTDLPLVCQEPSAVTASHW